MIPSPFAGIVGSVSRVDPLEAFLSLTVADVERQAAAGRGSVTDARGWLSLARLMRRKEYEVVGELGVPAATSWAGHLGVVSRPKVYATE